MIKSFGKVDAAVRSNFYTFNGYMKKDEDALTASMEDYLEMIYRLSYETGFTRIHILSKALNVQPSSATKMVQNLAQIGMVKYERYGFIMLEEKGKKTGAWLLKRHTILEDFSRIIGVGDSCLLEETEKTEHMFSKETILCFADFVEFMRCNPDILERYKAFKNSRFK
ncbi:MAG: Fur family transcriptional regulator [Clostridiales bacterium]|nr:Fur family transcriptional regulator [Clostridiales bacterium]